MRNLSNDHQTRIPARQTSKRTNMTQRFTALLCFVPLLLDAATARAESWLVHDGQAQADIIIAEEPTRTQRLAARELQIYVEKISGASLSIATAPSAEVPVHIYVGESAHSSASPD